MELTRQSSFFLSEIRYRWRTATGGGPSQARRAITWRVFQKRTSANIDAARTRGGLPVIGTFLFRRLKALWIFNVLHCYLQNNKRTEAQLTPHLHWDSGTEPARRQL